MTIKNLLFATAGAAALYVAGVAMAGPVPLPTEDADEGATTEQSSGIICSDYVGDPVGGLLPEVIDACPNLETCIRDGEEVVVAPAEPGKEPDPRACGKDLMGPAFADTHQFYDCLDPAIAAKLGLEGGLAHDAYEGRGCANDDLCYDTRGPAPVVEELVLEPVVELVVEPKDPKDPRKDPLAGSSDPVDPVDPVDLDPLDQDAWSYNGDTDGGMTEVEKPKSHTGASLSPYGGALIGKDGIDPTAGVRLEGDLGRVVVGGHVAWSYDTNDRDSVDVDTDSNQRDTLSGVGYFLEEDTTTVTTDYQQHQVRAGGYIGGQVVDKQVNDHTNVTVDLTAGLEAVVNPGNAQTTDREETKSFWVNQEEQQRDSVEHNPVEENGAAIGLRPNASLRVNVDNYDKHVGWFIEANVGYDIDVTGDNSVFEQSEGLDVGIYSGVKIIF